ncbi:uncharacterized protein LAJ45_03430 [Morchella importuna]|uniref:Uncharacterized protein n=1 Tax=Morchella conica CCBAS932 TaxID=1392247 RepID=A0A3N4KZD9_9PEZI|nr:uncharacterized protein LAJ45_03430 [Morchella importuna]KAH8152589.1 hypothetical protein LAJ45_03430 [Morchella importuna]RPB11095.1 hypothetical protein P167DRAFT_566178 [Morchella conica CCBAS932]
MAAMESEKIRQPREKLNARPLAVWILLGVTMEERANILDVVQEVYDKHRLVDQDTGFTRIPKHILAEAKSDLIKRLPLVFEKCETDWFADWALNRRHLKRNRGRQSNSVQQQQQQFPDIPPPGGFDVPPRSNGSSTYPGDTGHFRPW